MTRKVRHPYQILEASEMVVGQLYAFVHACNSGGHFVSHYTMGGVFDDTHAAARRLGHYLDSGNPLKIEMLLAAPDAGPIVTVHMDGWWFGSNGGGLQHHPTLMYWRKILDDCGWDMLASFLGPERWGEEQQGDTHCIVVPSQRWDDDPRLHVTKWNNPDGVVERVLIAGESATGWERKMKARTHTAMAKMLGF